MTVHIPYIGDPSKDTYPGPNTYPYPNSYPPITQTFPWTPTKEEWDQMVREIETLKNRTLPVRREPTRLEDV